MHLSNLPVWKWKCHCFLRANRRCWNVLPEKAVITRPCFKLPFRMHWVVTGSMQHILNVMSCHALTAPLSITCHIYVSLAALPIEILRQHRKLTYQILPTEQNRNRRITLQTLPWGAKWKNSSDFISSVSFKCQEPFSLTPVRTKCCQTEDWFVTCTFWTLDSEKIQAAHFTKIYVYAI